MSLRNRRAVRWPSHRLGRVASLGQDGRHGRLSLRAGSTPRPSDLEGVVLRNFTDSGVRPPARPPAHGPSGSSAPTPDRLRLGDVQRCRRRRSTLGRRHGRRGGLVPGRERRTARHVGPADGPGVRAIGDGHRLSIGFRTGLVDAGGDASIDVPSPFATIGQTDAAPFDAAVFRRELHRSVAVRTPTTSSMRSATSSARLSSRSSWAPPGQLATRRHVGRTISLIRRLQLGNCGSPTETDAGWLALTHGVGPMRTYSIGAIMLDLGPDPDPRPPPRAFAQPGARRAERLRAERRLLLRRARPRRHPRRALPHRRRRHRCRYDAAARTRQRPQRPERLTSQATSTREIHMPDKSPQKPAGKKTGRSLKETREAKREKKAQRPALGC